MALGPKTDYDPRRQLSYLQFVVPGRAKAVVSHWAVLPERAALKSPMVGQWFAVGRPEAVGEDTVRVHMDSDHRLFLGIPLVSRRLVSEILNCLPGTD